ncbi:MAG: PFL family protein [Limnochordales bacterium]|nr:PFL family protein [Limnochordales bacterium]
MPFTLQEILETIRMVEVEHFDIRTVTLGISLRDCITPDPDELVRRVLDKITRTAARLVPVAREVESELGIPIINQRIAVTPISLVAEAAVAAAGPGTTKQIQVLVRLAEALDRAAREVGVNFIGGYSALVEKGLTRGDEVFLASLSDALAATERLCASVNAASSRAGINMDALRLLAEQIKLTAEKTASTDGSGCARLVVFANMPGDNPFMAGAVHGIGEPEAVLNVGISGPGVVLEAIRRLGPHAPLDQVAETVKRTAFKISRAGELVGREVARRLGVPFGILDLSLAPTPAVGDSVAEILEAIGVDSVGAPGTTAALALLIDAVKKGGAMASAAIGGLSGGFVPVTEDRGMCDGVEKGSLSLEKLEAMTAVCSVGLDMVPVPGDIPTSTLVGILADELSIGVINHKTTAVRIIPVPGKKPGDSVRFGGLLGGGPVMRVSPFGCEVLAQRGGRIPAPLTSLRN